MNVYQMKKVCPTINKALFVALFRYCCGETSLSYINYMAWVFRRGTAERLDGACCLWYYLFRNTSKTHVMQAGTHRGNGQQQTICSHRHFTGVSTLHAHIHRRSRGNATVVNWALLNPSFKLLETFSIIWIFPGKIKQTQIIATM